MRVTAGVSCGCDSVCMWVELCVEVLAYNGCGGIMIHGGNDC